MFDLKGRSMGPLFFVAVEFVVITELAVGTTFVVGSKSLEVRTTVDSSGIVVFTSISRRSTHRLSGEISVHCHTVRSKYGPATPLSRIPRIPFPEILIMQ